MVDGVIDPEGDAAVPALVSRIWDGDRMVEVRSRIVGRRTCRMVAVFRPALEDDATILRFMQSVRYFDSLN